MRYSGIETISFKDIYGDKYAVKDLREIPSYTTAKSINIVTGDRIDELTTRRGNYGDDSESEIYKIVEHNIVELYENKFSLDLIDSLNIPVR